MLGINPELKAKIDAAGNDFVLPFQIEGAEVRGRLVRLGSTVDAVLADHDYPNHVSIVLCEAVLLSAMLGSALKFDGTFSLQTSSDGPLGMLVADYRSPGTVRAYAKVDTDRLAATQNLDRQIEAAFQDMMGKGHLAFTVDQGPKTSRYQGVVPIEGANLTACAHTYFRQSEQIATSIKLAVARALVRDADGTARQVWRAGGMMIQHLPEQGGRPHDLPPGDIPEHLQKFLPESESPTDTFKQNEEFDPSAEHWNRTNILFRTLQDDELLDPSIPPETLLYRLYHEDGVRIFEPQSVAFKCRCSRTRVESVLNSFEASELSDMVEDGLIKARCEFCAAEYTFPPGSVGKA